MPPFRVQGKASIIWTEVADIGPGEQGQTYAEFTDEIDVCCAEIEADSECDACDLVLEQAARSFDLPGDCAPIDGPDAEWVEMPEILNLDTQQDILMRRAGAPVLPGMEFFFGS